MIPRIALTSGEPAGIGPELCLALAAEELPCELVCLGDRSLLEQRARDLKLTVALHAWEGVHGATPRPHARGSLSVLHLPLAAPSLPGKPDPANAPYVLALLDRAVDGALGGRVRRHRHRAGAQERHQRRRHRLQRAHGISRRAHAQPARGDDADQRGAARGARHHAPAAARGERRHQRRFPVRGGCDSLARARRALRSARPAHRGVRPEPARRRERLPRRRGAAGDRARHRAHARRGHPRRRTSAGRYGVRAAGARRFRCGARHVSRPGAAGGQVRRLRARRQRDARPAAGAHLARSRHRLRSGRDGTGGLRAASSPRCSSRPGSPPPGADGGRGERSASAAPQALRPAFPARPARCSRASCARSIRAPAITWWRSGPVAARSPRTCSSAAAARSMRSRSTAT